MDVLNLFSLKGNVALVTGGAGLYGRQLVAGMLEAGARTFVAARNLEPLKVMEQEARARGLDLTALSYDQGEESSINGLRDAILEKAGTCDVLINNAVLRPMKNGYQSDLSTFDLSMKVNATGLFAITRAFGDAMAERGGGSIVNIGSMQGIIAPDPWIYEGTAHTGWYPDYFFHKAGMINFTRFTASYYGLKNVRCNCVAPGGYQTEKHDEVFLENYARKTMLGRMANDNDLKGVVVFLASDAASYVTGTTLPVDAGYTAK
jgi:NAD(P)-dependent dehydrogenase (short-subunit alcohol dehydrogenase family)